MKRRRFSVSGPPTGIGGRRSQYEPGDGSSSQPRMRQGGSVKDHIDIEREREHGRSFRGVLLHNMTWTHLLLERK